jgi:hypothetical protein
MPPEKLREGGRKQVDELQLEVRSLLEEGLSAEEIEARLDPPPPMRAVVSAIAHHEIARVALHEASKRLDAALETFPEESAALKPAAPHRVLRAEERGHSDYYGARRDAVMAEARARTRELAAQGLSAPEIQNRIGHMLTDTERELIAPVIRREVATARRARVARSINPQV